jgi:hypothetical protein
VPRLGDLTPFGPKKKKNLYLLLLLLLLLFKRGYTEDLEMESWDKNPEEI